MKDLKLPKGMMYIGDMDKIYIDLIKREKRIKTFGVLIEAHTSDHYLIDKSTGTMVKYEKYEEQLKRLLVDSIIRNHFQK